MKNNSGNNYGINGIYAFVFGLISFVCVALIGVAGFLKFSIDGEGATLTDIRIWSLGLTMITWCSLILAAGTTAALYLALRNRQAIPLRALAQSVENLSRGDMQTPTWGMERKDAIGELARAVDLARYHFSSLPDLSLMSDQGPVRIKFEGETRSLFSAMMQNIIDDYERARVEAAGFTTALADQQQLLTTLSTRISKMLVELHHHGANSEQTLQNLTSTLTNSARAMVQTQERSTKQLSSLIPFMQERAQNMAEVTHIAGTKVTKTLQSMIDAEHNLSKSATDSQQVIQQLTNTTNQMGERLFAAVNLMQASGKVLAETTSTVQSNMGEAIDALGRGETHLKGIITRAETRLDNTVKTEKDMAALAARTENSAERMEAAVRSMGERHESLSEQVVMAAHRMESIVNSFDGAQRAMGETIQQMRRDGGLLGDMLQDLRNNNDQLLTTINSNSQTSHGSVQNLTERGQALLQRLELQISQQAQATETRIEEMTKHSNAMSQQALTATSALAQTMASLRNEQDSLSETRTRISGTFDQIGANLERQAFTTFSKTEQWAEQSFSKLTTLTENIENIMQRLNMLGQLTGTLGSVAGQLGQLVPVLTQHSMSNQGGKTLSTDSFNPDALLYELQTQWQKALVQIEAMHDGLAQLVIQQKDQLETRLVVMDKKLKSAVPDVPSDTQQTAIMNDIVNALSKINDHVMQLDEVIMEKEAKEA